VSYSQRSDTVTASGHVSLLLPTGEVVFADFMELRDSMNNAFAQNVRMLLADRSRLAANTARRTNGNRFELRRGVYSPCDLCKNDPSAPPAWQLRAREISDDKELKLIEFRDAVMEIDYAATQLHADGFILVSNYQGRYLGDERFEPAFAALNRHHATVFIHPVMPAGFELTGCGLPGPLIEFPMDTARTVVNALWAGVLARHPNLRFILAHAGGVLPVLAPRILDLAPADWVPAPTTGTDSIAAQLRSLYADTAIAATPGSLAPLLGMTTPDHVLFGTDFPAAPITAIESNIAALRDSAPLGGDGLAAIAGNPGALFPAAYQRLSTP